MSDKKKKGGWYNDPKSHSIVGYGAFRSSSINVKIPEMAKHPTVIKQYSRPFGIEAVQNNDITKYISQVIGTEKEQKPVKIPEYKIEAPSKFHKIETLTGNEYYLPRFETLPDTEDFLIDHEHYVKSDMLFFDIPINEAYSVMDAIIPNVMGVDMEEWMNAVKKGDKKKLEELWRKARPKNILLVGSTGTGKTTFAQYLAKQMNVPFARIPLSKITVDDLIGHYEIKEDETVWVDGILTKAVKRGWVVLLDEINSADPEVLFALHSLTDDDRKLYILANNEVIIPHRNFRLLSAMNVGEAYTGTKELNMAFLDRFEMIPVEHLSRENEIQVLIAKKGVPDGKTAQQMAKDPTKEANAVGLYKYALANILTAIAENTREVWRRAEGGSINIGNVQVDADEFVPISTRRIIAWLDFLENQFKYKIATGKVNPKNLTIEKIVSMALDDVYNSSKFAVESHYTTSARVIKAIINATKYLPNDARAKELREGFAEDIINGIKQGITVVEQEE